jgi:hypothetical protein
LNLYPIRLSIVNILKEQLNNFLNFINNYWIASLLTLLIIFLRRFRLFRSLISNAIRRIRYFFISILVFFFAVIYFLRVSLLAFSSLLRYNSLSPFSIVSHFSGSIIVYFIVFFERFFLFAAISFSLFIWKFRMNVIDNWYLI